MVIGFMAHGSLPFAAINCVGEKISKRRKELRIFGLIRLRENKNEFFDRLLQKLKRGEFFNERNGRLYIKQIISILFNGYYEFLKDIYFSRMFTSRITEVEMRGHYFLSLAS